MTNSPEIADIPLAGANFVLKALGYGAMGITAVVLCLSYLLVQQLAAAAPPRPPEDRTWMLVQKYMRFAGICTAAMMLLQIVESATSVYINKKLEEYRNRSLVEDKFRAVSEWHWQWGKGGWETRAAFIKLPTGDYSFAATTVTYDGEREIPIVRWSSSEPIKIADEDEDIVFLGKRQVVAPSDLSARLNLGPQIDYPTRISLKRSWALTGRYSGPHGEGPFGDMMLYAYQK